MLHWMVFAMFLLQSVWPNNVKHTTRQKHRPNKTSCQHSINQSSLNSFLWTIDRDPPSYFFGTIHVPYTKVWNYIPDNTKRAFLQSQYVYFELDLTDPFTITALANCQLLPQGEYLSNILPKELFYRLKKHFDYVKDMLPVWMTSDQRGRGWYADYLFNALAGNWERKRPVWVMLLVNSLTEADIRSRGIPVLDLYLAQEAERLGKETGAVERVEEQCLPLNDLNFSQVLFALNQTLWHHERTRQKSKREMQYNSEDLIKHYNCGDLNSVIFNHDAAKVPDLVNLSHNAKDTKTAMKIDTYFRQELIFKRNQRMGERVIELLKEHPNKTFFFAFGAGHFLGNNTVIDHMQKKGFQIKRVVSSDVIPARLSESDEGGHPLSAAMISDQFRPFRKSRRRMDKHKMRHRKKKKRKKNRKDRVRPYDFGANFNDLWVRLDPNSPIFRSAAPTTPQPANLVKQKNNAASHHQLSLLRLIVIVVFASSVR